MWYFILGVIILLLIVKLALINVEIKSITSQLNDLVLNKTQKKLSTVTANKHMQKMCALINQNLTKQHEGQIAIKNHEDKLKQAISNLSHDLRTPLTSIMGYITMIKTDNSKLGEYLDVIESRAENLNHLVNEFYELSVIEDSAYNIELSKIDLVAVLTNTLMGNFAIFEQNGIKPKINIPDKAVSVIGNIDVYERIFQNLIANAVKYNQGNVNISLDEVKENCVITISNKTKKLNSEDIEKLFDRFYTADASRTNKNTGLGLYIVKTLCEKMGASVSCTLSESNVLSLKVSVKIN